jgi:hypothetical protein
VRAGRVYTGAAEDAGGDCERHLAEPRRKIAPVPRARALLLSTVVVEVGATISAPATPKCSTSATRS